MPVRNEENHLEEAVRQVLAQDYPGGVEVVLAVGPSKDATGEIAQKLAAADPRIRVVANPSGLIATANNAAIGVSRHPIVARVDGDYFAVMGLPVNRMMKLMRALGLTYEFGPLTVGP